ncbi:unnamed protein product [Vitrella brassicaformis CCMP3155]|uniref:Transmembrane protein n=3 Tax=Vitrella brassicaformis TaxID=1169539 RepID=A0A0G4GN15_VITBC|nr:unnamed protein product [Vitrella brassicaformis CCMP3155]|eukprot:CEM31522.1 unnamed protein product [Vitrella brassicaformis CCMP3155]
MGHVGGLAYVLTVLCYCGQTGVLDFYLVTNWAELSLLFVLLDAPLLLKFLLNWDLSKAAEKGAVIWIFYSWMFSVKLILLYFKVNEKLDETNFWGPNILYAVLLLTPVIYVLMMLRSIKQLFGSMSKVISISTMMHADMMFHVVLDLVDIAAAFQYSLLLPEQVDSKVPWMRNTIGAFIFLGVFFHSYSFSGQGKGTGPLGGKMEATEGPEAARGDTELPYGDVILKRKHSAIVSIFFVDIPLFFARAWLWFDFYDIVEFSPFMVKNGVFVLLQAFRLWQVNIAVKQQAHRETGSDRTDQEPDPQGHGQKDKRKPQIEAKDVEVKSSSSPSGHHGRVRTSKSTPVSPSPQNAEALDLPPPVAANAPPHRREGAGTIAESAVCPVHGRRHISAPSALPEPSFQPEEEDGGQHDAVAALSHDQRAPQGGAAAARDFSIKVSPESAAVSPGTGPSASPPVSVSAHSLPSILRPSAANLRVRKEVTFGANGHEEAAAAEETALATGDDAIAAPAAEKRIHNTGALMSATSAAQPTSVPEPLLQPAEAEAAVDSEQPQPAAPQPQPPPKRTREARRKRRKGVGVMFPFGTEDGEGERKWKGYVMFPLPRTSIGLRFARLKLSMKYTGRLGLAEILCDELKISEFNMLRIWVCVFVALASEVWVAFYAPQKEDPMIIPIDYQDYRNYPDFLKLCLFIGGVEFVVFFCLWTGLAGFWSRLLVSLSWTIRFYSYVATFVVFRDHTHFLSEHGGRTSFFSPKAVTTDGKVEGTVVPEEEEDSYIHEIMMRMWAIPPILQMLQILLPLLSTIAGSAYDILSMPAVHVDPDQLPADIDATCDTDKPGAHSQSQDERPSNGKVRLSAGSVLVFLAARHSLIPVELNQLLIGWDLRQGTRVSDTLNWTAWGDLKLCIVVKVLTLFVFVDWALAALFGLHLLCLLWYIVNAQLVRLLSLRQRELESVYSAYEPFLGARGRLPPRKEGEDITLRPSLPRGELAGRLRSRCIQQAVPCFL